MPPASLPEGFSLQQFERRPSLVALSVPCREVGQILRHPDLAPVLFKQRGVKNVVDDPGGDKGRRLVLLGEKVQGQLEEALPAAAWDFLRERVAAGQVEITSHQVVIGYEQLSVEEALACVLPAGVEVPTSFETVGHIAHFNLRAVHEPYKESIGRIVLDKNKNIRTVVNKLSELSNEFRTFDMEVLAGEQRFATSVKEQGMTFDLDYSEVYWNSKLSAERQRVFKQLAGGQVVVDMFAGIGAMSCFAATAGCRVHSNDLNPRGAHWQRVNVHKNQLDAQVQVHNLDARDFVRHLAAADGMFASARSAVAHVIMNLPELALDFLDVFHGICSSDQSPGPTRIHCYCFARQSPPDAEIRPRIEAALGEVPPDLCIVHVRDVAPKKIMYCVECELPLGILQGTTNKRRKVAD